jgi:hypothetical protein
MMTLNIHLRYLTFSLKITYYLLPKSNIKPFKIVGIVKK